MVEKFSSIVKRLFLTFRDMLDSATKRKIAQHLVTRRDQLRWSQDDVAKKAGCTQRTISEIEKGGIFGERILRDVATAVGESVEWLCGVKGAKENAPAAPLQKIELSIHPPGAPTAAPAALGNVHVEAVETPWREVRLVSWASAGAAKGYTDMADYLDEQVPTECKDKNAFAVIVDGDSMEPVASAGDRIVVAPNMEAQSGDLVIARGRKGHEVYFKKYLRHGSKGDNVRLVSFDPEYPPLEFDRSDFRFIYPVVNLVRAFRRSENGHTSKR